MTAKLRLLLVEDSEDDERLLIHSLKEAGLDVAHIRVETAESFVRALKSGDFDVVISDYQMPNFNAEMALSLLKESGLDLPFIIVSGTIGEATAVEAMKAGAHDYITKGNLTRLLPAITREMQQANTRAKLREKEAFLRQTQKMEAIGHLAGGIAHDFNNILAAILLYCDTILDRLPETDSSSNDVRQIKEAGKRAAALTRQLLAFSRKQALEPRVVELNAIVLNLEKMMLRLIGEDIHLTTDLDPKLGRIRVDPGQIEQVIINLVINSRDAMRKGGDLKIRTANIEIDEHVSEGFDIPCGKFVMLSVADTGCGMDEKTRARIFEPFFTTKGPSKGTGLGLSTVYGIIKQSKGYLAVRSAVDAGTTIDVYLPQLDLPPEPLDSLALPESLPVDQKKHSILVIEDEPDLRRVICRVLEKDGYTVTEVDSPENALEKLERLGSSIDLLITDVVMPQMSGPELAQRLVTINPGIKVLFISGYIDEKLEHYELFRNHAYFLQKPFSSDCLLRKVQEILEKSGYRLI